ncbi:MAG: EutN/CcmL family microcompartment protein, partial [Ignavibacteria bacterium]|nr:EutN/CcmL family microcompartment protein [Ignavibacteria bacterium]
MILAKVKGNLVSTQKNSYLIGQKLLLVHPIDLDSNFIGKNDVVAID